MKSTQLEMSSRSAVEEEERVAVKSGARRTQEDLQEGSRVTRTFSESAELLGDGPEVFVP